ncbi:hypothetical protein B0H14DRAFT_2650021 [Mycena olivaceomarginata]|nr:hypothetical protein B0H14DRAFT_2650021 [Mycena olivaceomarginata]
MAFAKLNWHFFSIHVRFSTTIMSTQTSAIDPKLAPKPGLFQSQYPHPRHKNAKRVGIVPGFRQRRRPLDSKPIRNIDGTRNEDTLREKARVRMAKRQEYLAFKQRLRRQEAFIAAHGLEVFRERTEREKSRQMALEREKWVEAQRAANQWARELREAAQPSTSSEASETLVFNVSELITAPEAAPITSFIDRASANGRSIVCEAVPVAPPSPLKRARLGERPAVALETVSENEVVEDSDCYTMGQENEDDDPPVPPLPRLPRAANPRCFEPSSAQDKSMNRWLRLLRDLYLVQLLRWDGCADASADLCPRPGTVFFFAKTSLKEIGLRIQFGHPPHESCTNPQPGNSGFVVLHHNGIHTVDVDFCGCDSERRAEPYVQLLRAGWYPATDERPQTAATFVMLDQFHISTLQAKTTAYDLECVRMILTTGSGSGSRTGNTVR